MALSDLPVLLDGYTLMVTESPVMKMRTNDEGQQVPVTDRDNNPQYVVVLFAKPKPTPDGRKGRGEEIKVTLPEDPGDAFYEGSYVELINARVGSYAIPDKKDPRKIANAGLSFKASGLKPVSRNADVSPAA
jgi:hypothetical protein